jgi:hypothetical protein
MIDELGTNIWFDSSLILRSLDEAFTSSIKENIQQRGEKKNKESRSQVQVRNVNPKWDTKGAKEQIMFQSPH